MGKVQFGKAGEDFLFNHHYTIIGISDWSKTRLVSLPKVQRGFVWKPYQIEILWDSLLREYPIGAFVLSPKNEALGIEGEFALLDGQQRATAICLGFNKETFHNSQKALKVFIDLGEPNTKNNLKYIFRVITRSHPWGYQRSDNTKTLDSSNVRKALELYGVENYLKESIDKFYPYDADFPVPFHYFTDAASNNDSVEKLKLRVKSWQHYVSVAKNARKKGLNVRKILERVDEVFKLLKNVLDIEVGTKIPALYLNIDMSADDKDAYLQRKDRNGVLEKQENNAFAENENAGESDDIENLFLRLNAGGTPLNGEELNYSILKANINRKLQSEIEKSCEGIFNPARFITIAYRLFTNRYYSKQNHIDTIVMRIKPKQFQKALANRESRLEFEMFLRSLLHSKEYHNNSKTLIEYLRHILTYSQRNHFGLPDLFVSNIADVAPEVMFMLLFRIWAKKDTFTINSDLHRKSLGIITLFLWIGRGEKQKNYSKLFYNIWPGVKSLKKDIFWSSSIIQRAMLGGVLTQFPSFNKGKKSLMTLLNYKPIRTTDILKKYDNKTHNGMFLDKIFYNRNLVLYSQRHFLFKFFPKVQFELDDTNAPFDWDHISAKKYADKKGIARPIKDWYESNGNLRAWPYSLNRFDQDSVPALKLNPLDKKHLEEKRMTKFDQQRIATYFRKVIKQPFSDSDLKNILLEWSACDKDWAACSTIDLKYDWSTIYKMIMKRNLSLCKQWYEGLKIEELRPKKNKNAKTIVTAIINNKKWTINPKSNKQMKDNFYVQDYDSWVRKPFIVEGQPIHIYMQFPIESDELLEDKAIGFGLFDPNINGLVNKIKVPEKIAHNYQTVEKQYIYSLFTLNSYDTESYVRLLAEFRRWLFGLPIRNAKNIVANFDSSLTFKYQKLIREEKLGN